MDDWTTDKERKYIDPEVGSAAILHAAFGYILANGGGTFSKLLQPVEFPDGFNVAWAAHEEVKPLSENVLMDFWLTKSDIISEPGNSLGAWQDGRQFFLDVSFHVPDQKEAIKMGKREQQLAIWDWSKRAELWMAYFDDEGNLIDQNSDPYVKPLEGTSAQADSESNTRLTSRRLRPISAYLRWRIGDHVRLPASQLVRGDLVGEVVSVLYQKGKARYRVAFDDGTTTIAEPDEMKRALITASAEDWHTVPVFDHRDSTKYKPGDTVTTTIGPAQVINTAHTPLGQLYRVTTIPSGQTFDVMETEIVGRAEGQVFAATSPLASATSD